MKAAITRIDFLIHFTILYLNLTAKIPTWRICNMVYHTSAYVYQSLGTLNQTEKMQHLMSIAA